MFRLGSGLMIGTESAAGVDEAPAGPNPLRLLTVCTANVCRSRISELWIAHRAGERRLALTVASGGVIEGGLDVPVEVRELMADVDDGRLDRTGAQIERADIDEADLIVCMARAHVREIVVSAPDSWPRTFTLKEIVRRGERIGPRHSPETIENWLDRAHEGRKSAELLGDSPDDDISDPYGGEMSEYVAAVAEITSLCDDLLALLDV